MGTNNDDSSTLRGLMPISSKDFDVDKKNKSFGNHDEPEVDYDNGATNLYQQIEEKNWDRAISRIDAAPFEAKTWVCRHEHSNPKKLRWRLLPLHATCVFRSPLSVIESLISAYPDGPKMRDDQSMLPVHLACRNGASKGVVLTLLKAFPESISVRDRKGRTPYDFVDASQSQNREAVIFALKKFKNNRDNNNVINENSDLVVSTTSSMNRMSENEVDYDHRTILFRLILKKDWTGVVQRSKSFPDEALTWIVTKGFNGNLRFLPLHKACVLQPQEYVIEALVEAFPDATVSKDQDGWLPIHCACFYSASEGVVNTLLTVNPKCSMIKDDDGRLPIHYACIKGATEGVVSALIGSNPKSAMSKDDEGRLPIHHACSKCAPEGTLDALMKAYPRGLQIKDDQGRLPLHLACRKNVCERTIRTMLRVNPRGAQMKDDQDKLPIHYACQNISSKGVVNVLLESYPESINTRDGFGKTPLEEVKDMENPKMDEVIEIMEKFKCEQDELNIKKGDLKVSNLALHSDVLKLSNRVKYLEDILGEITRIGTEIKTENFAKSGKEASKAVNKLVERLSGLNSFRKNNDIDVEMEKNVN